MQWQCRPEVRFELIPLQILRAADRPSQPWLMGGGVTRQVLSSPADADPPDFDWRISIAEISADGSFSSFAGQHRTIAIIAGGELDLTVDGRTHRLGALEPFGFGGSAITSAKLVTGPVSALNLMSRSGGTVRFSEPTGEESIDTTCLIVVRGSLDVRHDQGWLTLGALDACVSLEHRLVVRGKHAVLALIDPG